MSDTPRDTPYIVGIDPGLSGGIAYYSPYWHSVHCAPLDTDTLTELSAQILGINTCAYVYIEEVGHGRPGNAMRAVSTFARHCGHLDAFLSILNPYEAVQTVLPRIWMEDVVPDRDKGCPPSQRKRFIKARVQSLLSPLLDSKFSVTLKTCDALGILAYGMKKQGVSFYANPNKS